MSKRKTLPKLPAALAAAISLTLIMGCADQTTAPDALVLDGPSFARVPTLELPWKGNLTGTVTLLEWAGEPWHVDAKSLFDDRCTRESTYVFHARVVGEVTVLGRVTFYISHCGQFGEGYTDGRWFGVTADGSTLWGRHAEGGGGVIGFDQHTGQFYSQDEWEIEGGTGRFAGATGGGWERGVFNDPEALLSGQESYQMYQEGIIRLTPGKGNVPNMVPFRDGGTWWYVAGGDPTPCREFDAVFPLFVAWEGTGTHLGRFTGSETMCFDFSGRLIAYANQWTTANGDQLFGYGSILGDPPVQLMYEPGTSWEISGVHFVGGTGRFQGATGSIRYAGDYSLGANVGGTYSGEGWISTVGSGK